MKFALASLVAVLGIHAVHATLSLRRGGLTLASNSDANLEKVENAAAQELSASSVQGNKRNPSVLVIVFSRRSGAQQRIMVRDMWMRASAGTATKVRFGICRAKDGFADALALEQITHGDLQFLNCPEGYSKGALTKKAMAAMKAFVYRHKQRDFFMKVDDDTFVAWQRLYPFLVANGTRRSYIGVPIGTSVPCRNSSYRWYEPYETFNGTTFPPAMAGGSGYILGRRLAEKIIKDRIAQQHQLYNEDRAVGVWVDEAKKAGTHSKHIGIVGIDGFWSWDVENPTRNWQIWDEYPYMVHHGLLGETIACLSVVDWRKDPHHKLGRCFKFEEGRKFEKLVCYTQTPTEALDEKVSVLQLDTVRPDRLPDHLQRTRPSSLDVIESAIEDDKELPGGNAVDWKTNQQALIFIHIPKNSGTAIEQSGHAAGVWWPRKWLSFWHGVRMPDGSDCEKYHVPPQYLKAAGDADYAVFEDETFCITRHPYERAISEYKYMLSVAWGRSMSARYDTGLYDEASCTMEGLNNFVQKSMRQLMRGRRFIHDCHFVPQWEFVAGKDGQRWCKNVLRNEHLTSEFNALMERFRYPVQLQPDGEKVNNSSGCTGLSVKDLTDKTMRMLDVVYKDDFDNLNYSRGHPQVAFMHIPLTGGSSIVEAARGENAGWPGTDAGEQRMQLPDASWCDKRHVPPQYLQVGERHAYEDSETFCVTRHPYHRIVSLYRRLVQMEPARSAHMMKSYGMGADLFERRCGPDALNAFVRQALDVAGGGRPFALDCNLVPQNEYVWDTDGTRRCHAVLPFKGLNAAFQSHMASRGYSHVRLNTTRAPASRECALISEDDLDAHSRKLLNRYYADDFLHLGFTN